MAIVMFVLRYETPQLLSMAQELYDLSKNAPRQSLATSFPLCHSEPVEGSSRDRSRPSRVRCSHSCQPRSPATNRSAPLSVLAARGERGKRPTQSALREFFSSTRNNEAICHFSVIYTTPSPQAI